MLVLYDQGCGRGCVIVVESIVAVFLRAYIASSELSEPDVDMHKSELKGDDCVLHVVQELTSSSSFPCLPYSVVTCQVACFKRDKYLFVLES